MVCLLLVVVFTSQAEFYTIDIARLYDVCVRSYVMFTSNRRVLVKNGTVFDVSASKYLIFGRD